VKPLRIGVDARELLGASTGVGRYLGELLRRWTTRSDLDQRKFLLYAPEPLPIRLPAEAVDCRVVASGGRGGTWWEQVHLRRAVARDRPTAFFAPAYTAPLLPNIPLALTIHDISFVAHPEWFRMREGVRRRWLTRRSAAAASVILTDSEFSRSEIHDHFHIDRSRIHVIPPGLAPPRGDVRMRSGTPGGTGVHPESATGRREPLVLYVGSVFNRRRVPDLIAAFARVVRELPEARLVIAGENRSWPPLSLPDTIAAHGVASHVVLKDYVTDQELSTLYARASVFAFLSEYEGFGLTPLEALANDVPVVVLDTPVAREVYGDAAHYVRADDVQGTAETIIRLLRDPAAAAAVMANVPAVLERYSWDRCAAQTLEWIERIALR
jgi:glycosyltransferase involved in cell wall biosynthesis